MLTRGKLLLAEYKVK